MTTTENELASANLARTLYQWASSPRNYSMDLMILTQDPELCNGAVHQQRQSSLMMLPVELLQCINSLLDVPSAACWTLTCKRAACCLGLRSWTMLKRKLRLHDVDVWHTQRLELLRRLQECLPERHLCYFERTLRNKSPSGLEYTSLTANRGCLIRRHRFQPSHWLGGWPSEHWHKPSFCELQLIMNRHFWGEPHGFPLDFFDASEPWQLMGNYTFYYSKVDIDSTVIENELQFHVCQRILISNEEVRCLLARRERDLYCNDYYQAPPSMRLYTCKHLWTRTEISKRIAIINVMRLASSVHRIRSGVDDEGVTSRHPYTTLDCETCRTSSRFTAIGHGSTGVELVADVWQNLGSGRHPQNPGWHDCYQTGSNGLMYKGTKSRAQTALDLATAENAKMHWAKSAELRLAEERVVKTVKMGTNPGRRRRVAWRLRTEGEQLA